MPSPALAQAYQCTPPARIGPIAPVAPDGPPRRVAIGGYTLALSWSPEYCRGEQAKREPMQCGGASGRFGFVVHGLWPEAQVGPPPQWCGGAAIAPELLRRNLCMTPVPWLIAHEWAKHGSCMARSPEGYEKASAILWRSLAMPDADLLSRKDGLTVGALRQTFVIANPEWRADEVGVLVSPRGWLQELRLCYSRRYLPVRCPAERFGPADATPLKIWRGL
ncbi:MAG: ribonuclease T [Novosphingobium sp.]|nr:ribonuclease T [Novosphingobium sp.]